MCRYTHKHMQDLRAGYFSSSMIFLSRLVSSRRSLSLSLTHSLSLTLSLFLSLACSFSLSLSRSPQPPPLSLSSVPPSLPLLDEHIQAQDSHKHTLTQSFFFFGFIHKIHTRADHGRWNRDTNKNSMTQFFFPLLPLLLTQMDIRADHGRWNRDTHEAKQRQRRRYVVCVCGGGAGGQYVNCISV